jgi:hypothetical protein
LAGEFHDLRNPGSSQLVAFGAFLVAALGLVALVIMGVKAIGAEGRRRSVWLILMASLTFGLLAPVPLLLDVNASGNVVQCGHPFLARPDVDAALHQTGTAWAASVCETAISSRRSLAVRILSFAVALAVGAVVLLLWPRSTRQAPDLRAAGSARG